MPGKNNIAPSVYKWASAARDKKANGGRNFLIHHENKYAFRTSDRPMMISRQLLTMPANLVTVSSIRRLLSASFWAAAKVTWRSFKDRLDGIGINSSSF